MKILILICRQLPNQPQVAFHCILTIKCKNPITLRLNNYYIATLYYKVDGQIVYGTIQICVNKLDIKTVSLYMGHSTVETTLRIYTHPEQLDRETFLNGSLKEEEKLEILRKEYAEILAIIEDFLQ